MSLVKPKEGWATTTISWPFSWIFLNQPWIWQHMHKITKSKSMHIHTIRVYVCVCVFLMGCIFFNWKTVVFYARAARVRTLGKVLVFSRRSCHAAVTLTMLPPAVAVAAERATTSLGRSCSSRQFSLHIIQNCRFQMIYQFRVSICNADSRSLRNTDNGVGDKKKPIKDDWFLIFPHSKLPFCCWKYRPSNNKSE